MKPELIFVNESDGMVTMSPKEIMDLVDRAYQQGKADASGTITSPWVIHPTYTDKATPVWNTEITCYGRGEECRKM